MKMLCWLFNHDWRREGAFPKRTRCSRCHSEPYDDTTLVEYIGDSIRFGAISRVIRFVRDIPRWVRSRPCWFLEHRWSPYSELCQRCRQTGTQVAETGEWTYQQWKLVLGQFFRENFYVVKQYLQDQQIFAVQAKTWRYGIERSMIYIRGERYMLRYIVYLGPIGLRLHRFFRGDDDSAPHTHPWPFITFPFASYQERRFRQGVEIPGPHYVERFRFHYRPSTFEHIVIGRIKVDDYMGFEAYLADPRPFWTFVITGPKSQDGWGFYPEPGKFVYWREYKPGTRTAAQK